MWSAELIDQFPTFYSQYAIELLHSLGDRFDQRFVSDVRLRDTMIELAKQDECAFYKLALHVCQKLEESAAFDPATVFNKEDFNSWKECQSENTVINRHISNEPPVGRSLRTTMDRYLVACVHVTPTSTRIKPMEWTDGHRALRHEAFCGVENFCLVYLKPEASKKYLRRCQNYEEALKSGIVICNARHHFLGVSNSQLRDHSYWFVRATSLQDIHEKRSRLGDFTGIRNVGKYVSRLGLWFTKSRLCKVRSCSLIINDDSSLFSR
jgi:hypothetical protein